MKNMQKIIKEEKQEEVEKKPRRNKRNKSMMREDQNIKEKSQNGS